MALITNVVQETEWKKDKTFWFEDGNVSLIARGTEFRVFKGVLAAHSPVFADMFSLPQPVPPEPCGTGGPPVHVVHLDDSAEDFRHILRALMPSRHEKCVSPCHQPTLIAVRDSMFFLRLLHPPPLDEDASPSFHQISAFARLGHKYQMDHFVDEALTYLKSIFVTDLNQWQERVLWSYKILVPSNFQTHKLPWSPAAAIGVVNIARLTECTSLLPTAFLVCCTIRQDSIEGFEREDGTREKLNEDDFVRCYTAIPELMVASTRRCLFMIMYSDLPSCGTGQECQEWMRGLSIVLGLRSYLVAAIDPFWKWSYIPTKAFGEKLCRSCRNVLKRRFCRDQQYAWNALPDTLGIKVPGWGQTFTEDSIPDDVRHIVLTLTWPCTNTFA